VIRPVEARSARLTPLIDPDAELTCLGSGFQFSEGPVWSPAEECLYFSDIPGDTRWRWSESRGMEPVVRPSLKANGLVLDADGNLLVCEHVTSAVARYRPDGTRELLAYHCGGTYLNSPNDIVVRSNGDVYFSDPDYGRWNDWIGSKREPELGFKTVMRVRATGGGEAHPVAARDEFDQPNGLCFSPDESLLYVNDSPRAHIKVFDVEPDGGLAAGRVFFAGIGGGFRADDDGSDRGARHQELHDAGAVDGMKCDEDGNVWVTGPGGVWIISPEGEHLGVLRAPEVVGNLTWGGADLRSLFLMTSTTVHVVATRVGPARLPHHP
jgi:gluconolactonase